MPNRLTPGAKAALLAVLAGALCLILMPMAPWLQKWPEALTIPATDWIGTGVTWLVNVIKPVARWIAAMLAWPMRWTNWLLVETPWPLIMGSVAALGWYIGGWRMVSGVLAGLGFVLASGYWAQGMTTLSLVMVSVPLALLVGGLTGIAAYRLPRLRPALQTLLDVMQTIPTFAYLTPLLLLLGFGPVVGLIASAIYAAPPIARNVLLGLQRVSPEIREAGVMSGANRWQQLFLIELPAAAQQIVVGVNQTIMAALSMVIIAAVIGGFDDIGWAVLLTMRKADFGNSLVAGMVIVIFAVLMDRMSGKLAEPRRQRPRRIVWTVLAGTAIVSLAASLWLPAAGSFHLLAPVAEWTNLRLGEFTAGYGHVLNAIKNGAMVYGLLPLRVGLDHAVTPFTWGFQWTATISAIYFLLATGLAGLLVLRGRIMTGLLVLLLAGMLKVGIAHLPWPFVLVGVGALGQVAGGWRLAASTVLSLLAIMVMGLWEPALLSVYLSGTAVLVCALIGGLTGLASAVSPAVWRVVRPVCDLLQTVPLFVFLIPVLMFFQIGEFSALLAICAYAVVPMIRYTQQGLVSTPEELIEAAISSGATKWAILREVRAPYAAPSILLGLNQTILYAFSMLVIAALIGTTELGQQIYLALGQGDVGLGIAAGAAMALLALVADRLVQGFARAQREALGL